MTSPGEQVWDDLSAAEVVTALGRLSEQGLPAASAWLDTHQWSPLQSRDDVMLSGPQPGLQFRRAGLVDAPAFEIWQFDTAALGSSQRSPRALRRMLLAESQSPLMPAIGDVAVAGTAATIATIASWTPPPLLSRCHRLEAWPAESGMPQTASLASLRLDAFVAGAFHISRSEANTAIEHSYVFVNTVPVTKTAKHVAEGDSVVLRGKGRAVLLTSALNTRSGRSRIEYFVYPC